MDREQLIIDYLYGQLDGDALKQFEQHLASDKQLSKEVEELRQTMGVLSAVEDQEVIEPNFTELFETQSRFRIPSSVWTTLSIAASICLLMLVGYLTNFNVSYTEGNVKMAFSEIEDAQQPFDQLTSEDVEKIVNARFEKEQNHWDAQFTSLSSDLSEQLAKNNALQKDQINRLANQDKDLSDEQILAFVNQLKEENRTQLANFFDASARDQEVYMQNVLNEFSKFLQEQRMEDIQMLQANLLEMKTSSEEKQKETDKILASIITTVYNQDFNSIGR